MVEDKVRIDLREYISMIFRSVKKNERRQALIRASAFFFFFPCPAGRVTNPETGGGRAGAVLRQMFSQ